MTDYGQDRLMERADRLKDAACKAYADEIERQRTEWEEEFGEAYRAKHPFKPDHSEALKRLGLRM